MTNISKKIEDFLNEEVKEYSIHVVKERALPNIIDGFKPVQRKIVFTANKRAKKFMSTDSFSGYVKAEGGYEKGAVNIESAVVLMNQNFTGSNNYNFLEGDGSFGSRLEPNGAAAVRYTKTKISENFERFFTDFELHEYKLQDEVQYEPKYYLPIIPTVLLNGISGIAVGFACEFQPYNAGSIIENIDCVLHDTQQYSMKPYYNGYKGSITRINGKWVMHGVWRRLTNTTLEIMEIPVGISLEKYKEHLNKMLDSDIIKDYNDFSNKDGFKFIVKTTRDQMSEFTIMDHNMFGKLFKLQKNLNENLNAITENDTLKEFENPNEIISHFVKFKLKLMEKKKEFHINRLSGEMDVLTDKIRFIQSILQGMIELNFRSKQSMINKLKIKKYKYIDKLISIPVYNITWEYNKKLVEEMKMLMKESKYYKQSIPKELFQEELKNVHL